MRLGEGSPHLAVGTEVCGGDLEGDLVVGLFAHLLGQKVGLSHKGVGFYDLLPQSREALPEQLISNKHTHARTQTHKHTQTHRHQETGQEGFCLEKA